MATTTTFTVSASADDGQVTKSTSSATIPTSGWSSPSTSGSNIIVGAQENYDNWPNYAKHYLGFFRFQNITISKSATILSAYFKPYKSSYASVPLVVHGIAADNVAAPSAGGDLAASNFTSANVNWTDSVGSTQQTSSDIKTIIQEIVDRSGWSSGNSLMLALVTQTPGYVGQYNWNARSYDYSSASEAAELVIEYEGGGGGGGGSISGIAHKIGSKIANPAGYKIPNKE